ncbi:AI-2E family transporter [Clostridium tertium]|jgi:predicted PurR-regulated permease PerM|uniref:AI-2E family transporter n=1 Tax=Clostridium tertium TaxID=1559 RepID=A0A9X3XPZ5_9CLOT|nr:MULTISPECIES: AI-2E family transporter [Clostridium]MBP1867854.1 putative PurR-regulated permease PerM [Clostridium tertium]MBS5308018.1 AI-2E family transporter [Clostridium sp.]MDB1921351.1 AI-2E family transporter [Clostridium tertium]MDB1924596.1 AI-2E family transporter [Clostridium tertium]MDB1928125.1 AI-2E family transporter [Clostridium tertium]
MKVNWNSKYTTIAIYSFIVAISVILFYLAISQVTIFTDKLDSILVVMQPFIIGFSIAYIVNFLLNFYENKVFETKYIKKIKLKSKRGLAILFSYITTFFIISMFVKFLLPQLIDSVVGLVNDIPSYITNTTNFVNEIIMKLNIEDQYSQVLMDNFNSLVNYIIRFATNLIPALGGFLASVASSIWNVILGIIVSVYLLIDKEKLCALSKKITYGLFPESYADEIIKLVDRSNYTFGRFLVGKIIDSLIIGVLTFIILTIFKMPYTILVSVIVGITNIIPFFGPFIGAIPSFIIILFVSPVQALWFLLIILFIQQLDGNVIGPKILGDSIGISAFWILFSILVAGKLLGIVGMIIGVPLFAIFYSIVKEFIESKLRKKGLKTETKEYMK